jgi:uncharacterized membrane protein
MPRIGATQFAALYLAAASIFVAFLAIVLPPIQGPDEGAHYVRADQISRGGLIAHRIAPDAAGGVIDLGIMDAIDRFYPVVPDLNARVNRAMYDRIPWGVPSPWNFPNTAVYPPIFYLPSAVAILVGKRVSLDVLQTDRLARLFQGGASVAIATLAVALADVGCVWLFALLLLPSAAGLMGSLTQDGPLLASAALAGSLLLRLRRPGLGKWRVSLVVVCAIIALLGASRPPYAALVLLVLAASRVPLKSRAIACASVVAATISWWVLCAVHIFVTVDRSHAANPRAQIHYLLTHLDRIPGLIGNTMAISFSKDYAGFFITTFAPAGPYHVFAWYMLALAACVAIIAGWRPRAKDAALVLAAIGLSTVGIFLLQYLTWTPVGAGSILGVLGRYFVPLAAFLPLAMTGPGGLEPGTLGRTVPLWCVAPILAFPVASIVLTAHWIILRYYL